MRSSVAAKGLDACISSINSGSTTVSPPASSLSVLRPFPSVQLMLAFVPASDAILALRCIFQPAVVGDRNRLRRNGISKETADLY